MERGVRAQVAFGLRVAVVAMMLSTVAPKPVEAGLWCWLFGDDCGGSASSSEEPTQRAAPEIDPGALASAIALAAGGAAMLSDRVRRRR